MARSTTPAELTSRYFPPDSPESFVIPNYPDATLLKDTNMTLDELSIVLPPFPPKGLTGAPDDMYARKQRDAYRNMGLDLSAKAKEAKKVQKRSEETKSATMTKQPRFSTAASSSILRGVPGGMTREGATRLATASTMLSARYPPSSGNLGPLVGSVPSSATPDVPLTQRQPSTPSIYPPLPAETLLSSSASTAVPLNPADQPAMTIPGSGISGRGSSIGGGGFMEKLHGYGERLIVSKSSRESILAGSAAPPEATDPINSKHPLAATTNHSTLVSNNLSAPRDPGLITRAPRPSNLYPSLDPHPGDSIPPQQSPMPGSTVNNGTLKLSDLTPASALDLLRAQSIIGPPALDTGMTRKRGAPPEDEDDVQGPRKKAKPVADLRMNRENVPLREAANQARMPRSATVSDIKKSSVLQSRQTLTVPAVPQFTEYILRERTQPKPKPEHKVTTVAKGKQVNAISPARSVSSIGLPSVSFEPRIAAPLPQLNSDRHKQDFKSTLATWQRRSTESRYHPVPDFAAIHAREAERMAKRMVSRPPTTPAPLILATEERAKDREVFEKRLRERDAEMERLREQRRLEEEQMEELEIEMLRKKLDENVKAHEVPTFIKKRAEKAKALRTAIASGKRR